jgi:hypothetical protein
LLADYLSHLVRYPGDKIQWGVVVVGEEGVGKSLLGDLMCRILGEHNCTAPSASEVLGGYTGWLVNKGLVVVHELKSDEGRAQAQADHLKPLITQETVRANEKYLKQYTAENRANFLMFTNHLDALKLGDADRRYLVIHSPLRPPPPGPGRDAWNARYAELHRRITGPEASHAAHWLGERVPGPEFNPKGRAPETAAKESMKDAGLKGLAGLMLDAWNEGPPIAGEPMLAGQDVLTRMGLTDSQRSRSGRPANDAATLLRHLGYEDLGQHRMADGSKRRLWAAPDHAARLRDLPPSERARQYERRMDMLDSPPAWLS